MGKNILIFSDGTGQAGGLMPDERRSNVYKLYRATRCGPDSRVDPTDQLAFYDPGLGSAASAPEVKIGFLRKIYNLLSRATGLGITKNIIDCYSAIVEMWEPGDRIFLFGFSRGAYTARCLGGVLARCGVPTKFPDGPMKRDPASVRRIAEEAVKSVYQHGAGRKDDRFARQRLELAARFRERYGSDDAQGAANAVPYFIGVWDTVAALGISRLQQAILALVAAALIAGSSALIWWLLPINMGLGMWLGCSLLIVASLFVIWYLVTHVKVAFGLTDPWWKTLHITSWRMRFYDTELDTRVEHAKHALSIDENRADFEPVPWTNDETAVAGRAADWFEQVWFAGVHSDIGGSYLENEARLSDITLAWMVDCVAGLAHPVAIEPRWLNLFPSAAGMQHDERRSGWMRWKKGLRKIRRDAPLHPSVLARFSLDGVLQYDEVKPYRPEPLRHHGDVKHFY